MSNYITINFIPCDPTPANGYRLTWRVAGSGGGYTDEGLFTDTPIQFVDNINPAGTCYEGFLQSDCTESGESGSNLGNAIPWSTPCEESGAASNYTIDLNNPCVGGVPWSTYTINGGTLGDVVKLRASFVGTMQKTAGNFVRADLSLTAPDGTYAGIVSSGCYTDLAPHNFSITVDTDITMPGATETPITLYAVVNNGSVSFSGITLTIIEINGVPPTSMIWVNGCRGNSSTGGNC